MEKEYLDRKANSSTTKHLFGRGLLGKDDKRKAILEGLGFEEKDKDKWVKSVEGGWAYWDFRNPKIKNGRFFVAIDGGGFMGDDQAKELSEYIEFRKAMGEAVESKPKKDAESKPIKKDEASSKEDSIVLRGNEIEISNVVKSRRLDMIVKASSDPKNPGKGILYYDEKIGDFHLVEPSVELIDMVISDMGSIKTDIIEHGKRNHIDNEGEIYQTYYAIAKATDKITGTEGIGAAEELIDYKNMKREKNPKTFAMTNALRKACRNSCERLIPVPRKALVALIKEIMEQHKKTS